MNIEKSIEILKEFKKTGFHTLMIKYNEDRIHTNKTIEEAIETLLTAYEKEKEKNKELEDTLKQTQNSWFEDTKVIEKQSKEIEENKKYLVNLTHEQYIKLVEQIRSEINKEWKDKIKAKIEEINKEMLNEENSLELFYRKKYCKEVLQELLEKEI